MTPLIEIIVAITIHLILPALGILLFLKMRSRMIKENIKDSPIIELLFVFATYGGLLLVILTALFWYWSGMASLLCFSLIIIAPIAMGIILWRLSEKKSLSNYHKWTDI